MAFELQISPGATSPIFKQVVDQVRLGVATGKLTAGDQLPSVRALAERLLVNPNTVARAYAELARDGTIDSQPGRGVFVARPRQVYTRSERLRRLEPFIEALLNEGISLGFSGEELRQAVESAIERLDLPAKPQAAKPQGKMS
jgi:GntR family transcriptional regulator